MKKRGGNRSSETASRPEVFSQADSVIFCLVTNGDPRRSRAFRYRDSSYATPVCQQRWGHRVKHYLAGHDNLSFC